MADAKETVNELTEEEVNIYQDDCGDVKYDCVTDCLGVFPLLSKAN